MRNSQGMLYKHRYIKEYYKKHNFLKQIVHFFGNILKPAAIFRIQFRTEALY